MLRKTVGSILITSSILFCAALHSGAAITDTPDNLIVPAGETYTLSGNHSYSNSIQISGTLNVLPYNGTANTGFIELSAQIIIINAGGVINANGCGYRGGNNQGAGNGEGPGGGYASTNGSGGGYGGCGASDRSNQYYPACGGASYGSITDPTALGSGGGRGNGGRWGGNGGGSIKLSAGSTLTNDGTITANGSDAQYELYSGGGGSGGSIFIVTNLLEGIGSISANGGRTNSSTGGGGGGGRIALYYQTDNSNQTITAYGKSTQWDYIAQQYVAGGAGTVLRKANSQSYGDVRLDNNNKRGEVSLVEGRFNKLTFTNASVVVSSSNLRTDQVEGMNAAFTNYGNTEMLNLNLLSGASFYQQSGDCLVMGTGQVNYAAVLYLNAPVTASSLKIMSGGLVTHSENDPDFSLIVTGNMVVDLGGRINVNGKGYRGGDGTKFQNGEGPGGGTAAVNGGGGGHGGIGGTGRANPSDPIGTGGMAYGNMINPSDFGSGGGYGSGYAYGGAGGGTVKIVVNGSLRHNGVISADGIIGTHSNSSGRGGGSGAGGSISIIANFISGTGLITANGGNGDISSTAGGGGGGRISLFCMNSSFDGQVRADAGSGGNPVAQNGTILTPQTAANNAAQTLSNTSVNYLNKTSLSETVVNQYGRMSLNAEGTLRGTVNVTTMTIVTVKSGTFNDRGFCRCTLFSDLEGINYQSQCEAMIYPDQQTGHIRFQGVIGGMLDGSIDGYLIESMPGSGNYTIFNATWTFRLTQHDGQISCGKVFLDGSVIYTDSNQYPNTVLNYLQTSAQGTLVGGYAGAVNLTITNVRINDRSHPYNGEGFAFMSYNWNNLHGNGFGYGKATNTTDTDFKMTFNNPILGTAAGFLQDYPTGKSLWLVLTKLGIGEEPKPEISFDVRSPGNVSPGDTFTYTVSLKNNGLKTARNVMITIDLPKEVKFVTASNAFYYEKIGEEDWVNYPDPAQCPERVSWLIPEVPNKSVTDFNIQVKSQWGIPNFTETNAIVNVHSYDPEYFNK